MIGAQDDQPNLPHPLLARQLRRIAVSTEQPPTSDQWRTIITRVSAAYTDADQQQYLAERSLDVSLQELQTLNGDLQAARRRLEAVFDSASVGLCVVDEAGTIESVNPGAEAALTMREPDLIGRSLWDVITIRTDQSETLLDEANFATIAVESQPWTLDDCQVSCGTRDFSATCVLTPLGAHGTNAGAVLMLVDTTARKKAQADLAWRARYDALTGLANRETMTHRIEAALDEQPPIGSAAVVFIDLDRFKSINDSLGHAIGDQLLVQVSARLTKAVRSSDLVGRWAGDEFVIFCSGINRSEAGFVAQRIADSIDEPFHVGPVETHITASIGIAMSRAESTSDGLVGEADAAMYEAKDAGRGVVRLFDDDSRRQSSHRRYLEQQLRQALAMRSLRPAFQPQVHLAGQALVGFELLSRWSLPDGTAVPPNEFIPIAEETGLIHDLGWQIIEASATALAAWGSTADGLSLAVNVSSRQLQRQGFVDQLRTVITRHRIRPGGLTLEITESVLLDDPDGVLQQLRRIRDLGVRLAIDDFGTGYSSLSYLRRLPIDDVKIDREFIVDLTSSAHGRTIVDAVVRMCHALGFRVIAEGVETMEQALLLQDLGCDVGQGWIFGRPMPELEAAKLLGAPLGRIAATA